LKKYIVESLAPIFDVSLVHWEDGFTKATNTNEIYKCLVEKDKETFSLVKKGIVAYIDVCNYSYIHTIAP